MARTWKQTNKFLNLKTKDPFYTELGSWVYSEIVKNRWLKKSQDHKAELRKLNLEDVPLLKKVCMIYDDLKLFNKLYKRGIQPVKEIKTPNCRKQFRL